MADINLAVTVQSPCLRRGWCNIGGFNIGGVTRNPPILQKYNSLPIFLAIQYILFPMTSIHAYITVGFWGSLQAIMYYNNICMYTIYKNEKTCTLPECVYHIMYIDNWSWFAPFSFLVPEITPPFLWICCWSVLLKLLVEPLVEQLLVQLQVLFISVVGNIVGGVVGGIIGGVVGLLGGGAIGSGAGAGVGCACIMM